MQGLRLPVCQCSRALHSAGRSPKASLVTASAFYAQRTLSSTSSTRDAAATESPTPLELSGLNKSSQDADKQKNESTAVRALDRLSSALRIKEAGNERHHKLSRIRGGGDPRRSDYFV